MLAQQLSVRSPPDRSSSFRARPPHSFGDSGPASVAALGLGLGPGPQPVTPVTATSNAAVDKTKPFESSQENLPD